MLWVLTIVEYSTILSNSSAETGGRVKATKLVMTVPRKDFVGIAGKDNDDDDDDGTVRIFPFSQMHISGVIYYQNKTHKLSN